MKQILVVEDDSLLNKMLTYNLTADGYSVTSVLNARTAADTLTRQKFDLVLLDINLPGCSGFDICTQIREEMEIPVIFLTMGKEGSRAYYKGLRVEKAPYLQENTIETTGAGDTFGGSCLHFVLKYGLDNLDEEKLLEMLSFANGAASLITTRKGALKVMPEVDEVKKLIQ